MTNPPELPRNGQERRRRWLAALAGADRGQLEQARCACEPLEEPIVLRAPEIGMVMLRARVGGSGGAFNFAEATATRCALQFADGRIGIGVVLGRDTRKAELVALLDGALQDPARQQALWRVAVEPLLLERQAAHAQRSRAAAASRVEFYTLVRGAN
jgi:alpha-D-ribose 1-methylphosphonate 5-triphosphate synthase subunit PhnG